MCFKFDTPPCVILGGKQAERPLSRGDLSALGSALVTRVPADWCRSPPSDLRTPLFLAFVRSISPIVISQRRRICAAYLTIGASTEDRSPLVPCALHPVSVLRTCRVGPTFVPRGPCATHTHTFPPLSLSGSVCLPLTCVSCPCITLLLNHVRLPMDSARERSHVSAESRVLLMIHDDCVSRVPMPVHVCGSTVSVCLYMNVSVYECPSACKCLCMSVFLCVNISIRQCFRT